jgi:hypothetical protein
MVCGKERRVVADVVRECALPGLFVEARVISDGSGGRCLCVGKGAIYAAAYSSVIARYLQWSCLESGFSGE